MSSLSRAEKFSFAAVALSVLALAFPRVKKAFKKVRRIVTQGGPKALGPYSSIVVVSD